MSFSLSGSTITQTGVDNDLSGLSSITGVNTQTVGQTKVYVCPHDIDVNGTLSHDPLTEKLLFTQRNNYQQLLIKDGATYNYGSSSVQNGFTQQSTSEGLIFTTTSQASYRPLFDVESGATFNWNGGKITSYGGLYFRVDSNVNITDAVIELKGVQFMRSFTTNLNIDGLVKVNGGLMLYAQPSSFGRYQPIHSNWSQGSRLNFGILFYGPASQPIVVSDFEGFGNNYDISLLDNGKGEMLNAQLGSATSIGAWFGFSNSRSDGQIEFKKDIRFKLINQQDQVISGIHVWSKDTNNGNRVNVNGRNDLPDKLYQGITDASGEVDLRITTAIANRDSDQHLDRRSKNNDSNDTFDFSFYGYLIDTKISTQNLTGTGVLTVSDKVFNDVLVTESNKVTVDAYSELDTSAKLYDRAKSHLVDNYTGEDQTIITKTGNQINLRDLNLVIDATATSVFTLSGSTLTIHADTFTGDLTTTGTVTLSNGAAVVGTIIDSNADSSISFSGVDSWKVYSSESNRNSDTSELGTGTGTENYRFNFSNGVEYYLRLTVSGETIFKQVTPLQSGNTEVQLNTTALLLSLNSSIAQVPKNPLLTNDSRLDEFDTKSTIKPTIGV